MTNPTLQTDGSWLIENAPLAIDCDGSPHAYHPDNHSGLDDLRNGGPLDQPYGYEINPATRRPFVQGQDAPAYDESSRGFFVSATTYQRREYPANDPRRYLNSETELFIVVPAAFRKHVPGVVLGCRAEVTYGGKSCQAVVGDVGPRFGEASIAVAAALGIDANGRRGGVEAGVAYRIWPGVPAEGYELQPA
jgi:hypothetical protein